MFLQVLQLILILVGWTNFEKYYAVLSANCLKILVSRVFSKVLLDLVTVVLM